MGLMLPAQLKAACRTVAALGPAAVWERITERAHDHLFDWRLGTDTCRVVGLAQLAIASENAARGVAYHATGVRAFRRLLSLVRPGRDGAFVDFGCGKGRVLLLALECGFRRVVGVDFSSELCSVARSNLRRVRGTNWKKEAAVLCGDAANYEVGPGDHVFYLYHPFDEVVLAAVLSRIQRSLDATPREAWLIYANPVHRRVVSRCLPSMRHLGDFRIHGCTFHVRACSSARATGEEPQPS